jgi:hypothetical protein
MDPTVKVQQLYSLSLVVHKADTSRLGCGNFIGLPNLRVLQGLQALILREDVSDDTVMEKLSVLLQSKDGRMSQKETQNPDDPKPKDPEPEEEKSSSE